MIATRFMELCKRRGLMIALIIVDVGIPTIFLLIRLLAHDSRRAPTGRPAASTSSPSSWLE
jgi:hypothetical protein